MVDPYVGEIRAMGFPFVPVDWLPCDGSTVSISDYQVLFQLIGTTFGGDGQNTFGLPDLRGRVPLHFGNGTALTAKIGSESVTLNGSQVGAHSHTLQTAGAGNTGTPSSSTLLSDVGGGAPTEPPAYGTADGTTNLANNAIGSAGGSQPHENRQPYLVVNYIISASGIYPSQS